MFREQGFAVAESVLSATECSAISRELDRLQLEGAGTRGLLGARWCSDLAMQISCSPLVAECVPNSHVAIQCTYFEKSRGRNWLVSLHQDLSIPVAGRVEHLELSRWSLKEGVRYVQPPLKVLEDLVAVRVHIDPCGVDDGPVRVVPGSHALGVIGLDEALHLRAKRGEVACSVGAGGVLVMRPLILHCSSKAVGQSRRRVLHFLFGPRELPFGLRWHATG